MFSEYMAMALKKAQYKIIDDEYPYFAEVPELDGVWATGKTIEDCRNELIEVIEEWIVARLKRGIVYSNHKRPDHRNSSPGDGGSCLD